MSLQICPGCQGRNPPQAAVCDWCGRPFNGRSGSGGGFGIRWWHIATGLLFGLVVLATAALVFLNFSRLDIRPRPAAAPSPIVEVTALPTRAATAGLVLPTPISQPSTATVRTPAPAAEPSATPVPAHYVRVANTGGLGVFLREEPGPQSQRIQPALAEGAVLRLVGQEQTVQAQVWRLCEQEGRHVQGWIAAQYLQDVQVTPTPSP
jgi:hypothetical protein